MIINPDSPKSSVHTETNTRSYKQMDVRTGVSGTGIETDADKPAEDTFASCLQPRQLSHDFIFQLQISWWETVNIS